MIIVQWQVSAIESLENLIHSINRGISLSATDGTISDISCHVTAKSQNSRRVYYEIDSKGSQFKRLLYDLLAGIRVFYCEKETMMTLTNHAYERYAERVLGKSQAEVQDYLKCEGSKELIDEQLNFFLDRATFLVKASYHTQGECNYYLYDNLVIITNGANQAIVTVFYAEFGFGKELDKTIVKGLVENIETEKQKYSVIEREVDEKIKSNEIELSPIDAMIESVEAQLQALKEYKQAKELEIKSLTSKKVLGLENVKQLCYKIIYSVNYNIDKITSNKK